MKILHTSDWHLGKNFFNKKLTEEQALFFEKEFFPLLKEIQPDILIVTGDLVDKPNPDYETLELFRDILYRLSQEKIPAIFILGNHDSKRITLYKDFLKSLNLLLVDDLTYFKTPFELQTDKGERAYFYILPYLPLYEFKENIENFWEEKRESISTFLNQRTQVMLKDLMELILGFLEKSLKKPAFLLGHFALEKALFTGEETSLKSIGKEEIFPLYFFEKFDFLLLGHLHRIQKIGSKAYYAGSPLPYSFEEALYKKGVWFLELKDNILIKEESIHLTSPFKIKVIKGYFKELLHFPRDEAYIKVVLKDEEPVLHPFERLKTVFPNLLVLEYEDKNKEEIPFSFDSYDATLELFDKREIDLNEENLFKDFYKVVEGKEIDPKLFQVFKKYLKEFKENLEISNL